MDRIQRQRTLRENRRKQGVCVGCGKELEDKKYVYCASCREKNKKNKSKNRKPENYEKAKIRNKAYKSRIMSERKSKGLCVRCGIKPAKENRVCCSECLSIQAEEAKKYRKYRKQYGFCPRCGKEKIYLNETMCFECIEKVKEYNKANFDKNNQRQKEYRKKRSEYFKSRGICYRCGKHTTKENRKLCEFCLAKARKKYHERKSNISRSELPNYGFCYLCGGTLDTEKKLCSKCLEKFSDNLKNFKGKRAEKHYWKKDNSLLQKGANKMAGFKNGKNNKISDHMVTGQYIGNTGKMIKPERRNQEAYKNFKRPLYGMKVGGSNES